MTITNVKAMVVKGVAVGLLAGAFALAAPAKAEAQQFAVGVRVGYPHYDHYDYARRDFYERQRIEQERRHEEWVRAHERDRYRYGNGYRGRW
jgi:hypothetical protein